MFDVGIQACGSPIPTGKVGAGRAGRDLRTTGIRNLTGLFSAPHNRSAELPWGCSELEMGSDNTPPRCMIQLSLPKPTE